MRLLFILLAGYCTASAQVDDQRLLNAIGQVESGLVRNAVGDRGRSLGQYQMSASAWKAASDLMRSEGLPVWSRSQWRNPLVQDAVALAYLRVIRSHLIAKGYANPSVEQIAVCWNMGTAKATSRGMPLTDYAIRVKTLYTQTK